MLHARVCNWRGREGAPDAQRAAAQAAVSAAEARRAVQGFFLSGGQSAGLARDIAPAEEQAKRMVAEAEAALGSWPDDHVVGRVT